MRFNLGLPGPRLEMETEILPYLPANTYYLDNRMYDGLEGPLNWQGAEFVHDLSSALQESTK